VGTIEQSLRERNSSQVIYVDWPWPGAPTFDLDQQVAEVVP
jgi:hypothetical protein